MISIDPRAAEMRTMREAGETYSAIGERFGLSHQRVRQIIATADRKIKAELSRPESHHGISTKTLNLLALYAPGWTVGQLRLIGVSHFIGKPGVGVTALKEIAGIIEGRAEGGPS